MADNKVIDTHLHLWDTNLHNYPWLNTISLLNKPYLPEDYLKATSGIVIEKAVFVQCECEPLQYFEEVKWVTSLSLKYGFIRGIVAWVPLEKGEDIRYTLELLSKNRLVKGIRRIIQYEEDMEFCLKPDFIKGVQFLDDYGFSFDICISHIQLKNIIKFVSKCPKVSFILDHIGKPDIKNKVMEPWKSDIRELSKMLNVNCKISGLTSEAEHYGWTEADLKPYILYIIDCFGFDRILYGGDWPVVLTASFGYGKWFSALSNIMCDFDSKDLQKFYYKNANRIYNLT